MVEPASPIAGVDVRRDYALANPGTSLARVSGTLGTTLRIFNLNPNWCSGLSNRRAANHSRMVVGAHGGS